jgi:hypothetical protein
MKLRMISGLLATVFRCVYHGMSCTKREASCDVHRNPFLPTLLRVIVEEDTKQILCASWFFRPLLVTKRLSGWNMSEIAILISMKMPKNS